jgi:hypothetical protein
MRYTVHSVGERGLNNLRVQPMLKGLTITCNYLDDTAEAAVPEVMTVDQFCETIRKLIATEPDIMPIRLTPTHTHASILSLKRGERR